MTLWTETRLETFSIITAIHILHTMIWAIFKYQLFTKIWTGLTITSIFCWGSWNPWTVNLRSTKRGRQKTNDPDFAWLSLISDKLYSEFHLASYLQDITTLCRWDCNKNSHYGIWNLLCLTIRDGWNSCIKMHICCVCVLSVQVCVRRLRVNKSFYL